jgi:hypothetical protein
MAFCPSCNAKIDLKAMRCPDCGYDFASPRPKKSGIAYSWLADLALFVGCFCAGICCIAGLVGIVSKALQGDFLDAFVTAPLMFFLSLAMLVVFLRMADQGTE